MLLTSYSSKILGCVTNLRKIGILVKKQKLWILLIPVLKSHWQASKKHKDLTQKEYYRIQFIKTKHFKIKVFGLHISSLTCINRGGKN